MNGRSGMITERVVVVGLWYSGRRRAAHDFSDRELPGDQSGGDESREKPQSRIVCILFAICAGIRYLKAFSLKEHRAYGQNYLQRSTADMD